MNLIDLNLDMMSLAEKIPDRWAVFYFLLGEDEEEDFLYAKGSVENMSEALCNLMGQHEDIEWMVKNAVKEFQEQ